MLIPVLSPQLNTVYNIVYSGGNAPSYPVYTLTCDAQLGTVTVIISNALSGESVSWTGDIDVGDVLVFDASDQSITLNGEDASSDMDTGSVTIPCLLPGTNPITVTGFSGLKVTVYPKRYA